MSIKTSFKDSFGNEYNFAYVKGCCQRRGYQGFSTCIMSKNGETELFKKMKAEVCSKLNNQFGNFTTQCENGEFERKIGNKVILSLKNDYTQGAYSDIQTVFVESNDCLDLN